MDIRCTKNGIEKIYHLFNLLKKDFKVINMSFCVIFVYEELMFHKIYILAQVGSTQHILRRKANNDLRTLMFKIYLTYLFHKNLCKYQLSGKFLYDKLHFFIIK